MNVNLYNVPKSDGNTSVCVFQGLVCASGKSLCAVSQAGRSSAALPESGIRPVHHQPATCRAAERRHVAATMLSGVFWE